MLHALVDVCSILDMFRVRHNLLTFTGCVLSMCGATTQLFTNWPDSDDMFVLSILLVGAILLVYLHSQEKTLFTTATPTRRKDGTVMKLSGLPVFYLWFLSKQHFW